MDERPESPEPASVPGPLVAPKQSVRFLGTDKKRKALIGGGITLAVLAVVGAVAAGVSGYRHQTTPVAVVPSPSPSPVPTAAATPTPAAKLASLLDGTMVDQGSEALRPLAVMVENHPDARPQSGLSKASLVYEAIAEGGITRFMAVFRDPRQAVRVGPIRSARTYYVHYAEELNALYAHAGGNRDALDEIAGDGIRIGNLDGLTIGSPVFVRDTSRQVASEHTLYSDVSKLWAYGTGTAQITPAATFAPWKFMNDVPEAGRPASQHVHVSVSAALYSVDWDYDKAANTYFRSMAGAPHRDAIDQAQVSAKNVVLQTVTRTSTVTRVGEDGWIYGTSGTGKATIIQNGTVTNGTWKQQGSERTRYFDVSGQEISFVRGTTWVHLIHDDTVVTF